MGVPQFVRFIDNRQIPLDFAYVLGHFTGIVIRGDDNGAGLKRIGFPRLLTLAICFRIQDNGGQVKLFFQLDLPLLA